MRIGRILVVAPPEAHEFRTYLKYWSCGYPALMILMKSTAGETANATLHLARGNREIGLTFAWFLPCSRVATVMLSAPFVKEATCLLVSSSAFGRTRILRDTRAR
jgi:hypothetical protein